METIRTVAPQWRRKHKIILKASFSWQSDKAGKQMEEVLSQTMGGMWIFDNSN